MSVSSVLLSFCLVLVPSELRVSRREQWEADLEYGYEAGVGRPEVVTGALIAGVRLRALSMSHETWSGIASIQKGKVMKFAAMGAIGAVLLGGAWFGVDQLTQDELPPGFPPDAEVIDLGPEPYVDPTVDGPSDVIIGGVDRPEDGTVVETDVYVDPADLP